MTPEANRLINGISRAVAALEEHGVVAGSVEITKAQYDALREVCTHSAPDQPDNIFGLKVIVRD